VPNSPFPQRYRRAIALAAPIVIIVVLVLVYRASAPKPLQTTNAAGGRIPASEVLQVGALPVT
jgi:hypothetical protein